MEQQQHARIGKGRRVKPNIKCKNRNTINSRVYEPMSDKASNIQ